MTIAGYHTNAGDVFGSLIRVDVRTVLLYTCNLFQANKTVSSLLSVHARQMQQAKSPQRLPVPASLVVHLIAALQSSEWSTKRARIRDGSSTPVRCPERISVTSLR